MLTILTTAIVLAGGSVQATPVQTAPAQSTPAQGASAPAAAAPAQSAAEQVKAGATVYDAAGGVVGQVTQVSNGAAVVSTGAVQVGVPVGNFAAGPSGPVLGMTKAELEAAAQQGAAQSQQQTRAALVAGAEVRGVGGQTVIGSVKAVEGDSVTVTSAKGGDVKLPASGFALGANGLIIGLSAADFDKAVAASRP